MPPVVKKCKEIDCMHTEMLPVVKKCKEIDCMPTEMLPVVKKCKEIDCMRIQNASCSKEMYRNRLYAYRKHPRELGSPAAGSASAGLRGLGLPGLGLPCPWLEGRTFGWDSPVCSPGLRRNVGPNRATQQTIRCHIYILCS